MLKILMLNTLSVMTKINTRNSKIKKCERKSTTSSIAVNLPKTTKLLPSNTKSTACQSPNLEVTWNSTKMVNLRTQISYIGLKLHKENTCPL
jgi:hypothetical protein